MCCGTGPTSVARIEPGCWHTSRKHRTPRFATTPTLSDHISCECKQWRRLLLSRRHGVVNSGPTLRESTTTQHIPVKNGESWLKPTPRRGCPSLGSLAPKNPIQQTRQQWDSNPRGQSPMGFEPATPCQTQSPGRLADLTLWGSNRGDHCHSPRTVVTSVYVAAIALCRSVLQRMLPNAPDQRYEDRTFGATSAVQRMLPNAPDQRCEDRTGDLITCSYT